MTSLNPSPVPYLPSRDQVVVIEHKTCGLLLLIWLAPADEGVFFYWRIVNRRGDDETGTYAEDTFANAQLSGLIELHKLYLLRIQEHPSGRSN